MALPKGLMGRPASAVDGPPRSVNCLDYTGL